jgi:hypothetical protein
VEIWGFSFEGTNDLWKKEDFRAMPRSVAIASLFLVAILCAYGQTQSDVQNPSVQEPELVGKVFLLDANTHTLRPLPGEPWKRKNKTKWASTEAINVVDGPRSSFRVSSGDKIVFVIKPFPNSDLSQMKVYPFEVKSHDRTCIVGMLRKGMHEGNTSVVSLDAIKYGSSSYALSPPNSHLSPGEYWVAVPGAGGYNDPLITIGVD